MSNKKKVNANRVAAYALSGVMLAGIIPYNVFASPEKAITAATTSTQGLGVSTEVTHTPVRAGETTDATSSATYYRKANWENKIKDKSRWPIGDNQRLVRVSTSDPLEMNDVNYDGAFIDANGRTVLRLIYREKAAATSGVWYRALFNFGDLDQYIDYDKSYVVGRDGETKYDLKPFNDRKERLLDIGRATGDRTNQRKNLPINLVLNEGLRTKDLGDRNYIVQMRITNGDDAKKIYAYAPGKSSMDYSSYTKTTSVSLSDKVDSLFVKGGQQSDSENATNQEFFMSEFIANPEEYADTTNIGIIRTQYKGQRKGTADSPTVGGEPIAFVQVFDAKLVPFLKEEADGTIAYTNLLNEDRTVSKFAKKVKIKKTDINYSKDGKLAYIVLAPKAFQKDGLNKVEISKHDQYTMLQGFYFTSIDYLVDKTAFANNFGGTNKLDYSMMSGWMNPNINGWTVFEKEYENDYRVPEGESYLIDVGTKPASNQIMIQIGDETRALYRKPQGYYNGYVTGKNGIDQIEEFAKGVYKFTLREGATIEAGQKIRILVPYVGDHPDTVNFLEANDGTDYNKGSAQLRLQKDRNINMHLYTDLPRGASFVLRYTLKGETEEKSLKLETPKVGTLWQYKDTDKVLTGLPNRSILSTGGNFYIDTTKLEPGKDIFVDAYDEKGNKLEDKTSYFRYSKVNKVSVHKDMTWVDHSDTSSILSINKSLYTPYQLLFTNDYAEGTDDFYKDPRAFTGTNENFMKDTKEFVGYTKYDGGKVRTLYEEGKVGKLYAKVEAAADEYTDKGEIKTDNSKKITIPKDHIFDAQFDGENKEYRAYEYKVDLTKMLPYHSEDKTEKSLTLLKDMKFVSNASDGSSLPSDLYETRVRARVLFDANTGKLTEGDKQVDKTVKIVPDNTKFYGEDGYAANGFEGANVEANTGDKFPEAPKLEGKNFLGWVTEAGKTALGNKAVVTADAFAKLSKDQIFTNETPVTKHLVVYAIYSDETAVTFDANQGKFTDGKDTTTVKVESGSVTKPADPTREGYEFKGWADKKDATAPTEGILDNVTAPKTVYAVWEKKADAELTLKNPTPVEVKDLKSLTSDEKDKVADAVIAANNTLGLAKADITVADDGTVTVKTKDGKTGTLASEKTVKQKEVQNNFNPPKEPVKVENAKALTEDEIKQVKQAVKDANPDRNLKDEDITVEADGTVKINQGGKIGTIPAEKTVVQKDTILDLTAPEKTEVKDPKNLTQPERDKVAAAVKEKNSLPDTATITVDSKGNVTVKDGNKTGTLKSEDTVKPFTRDGKKLNPPAEKVKVGDTNKLTEAEKQAVKDAIQAANPELGFTDDEIQVDANGTVTVPMGESKVGTIPGTDTVEQAKDTDKIIKLVAPEKTPVQNPDQLIAAEKEAVKKAVKEANPKLPDTANIKVADDGSVTVTDGDKNGTLSQKDTVVKDENKLSLNKPRPVKVQDPQNVTTDEQAKIKEAVKAVNPTLTDNQIQVDDKGNVTVTVKEGEKTKTGNFGPDDTIEKDEEADTTAPAAPKVEAKDDGSVTVTPPTDADTKEVEVTYVPTGKTEPVKVTATKDPQTGKWSVPAGSDVTVDPDTGVITVPADKVEDGKEVSAVAKDKSGNTSTPTETSKANAKTPGEADTTAPAAPKVEAKDDGSVTVTPPTDADTKEVEVTYVPTGKTEPVKVTATKDPQTGKWSVPAGSDVTVDPDTGVITVPADKVEDGKEVSAVAKDKSGNTSTPTETSKANAKTPGEADTTAPAAPKVEAKDDGSVTVTPPTDADTKEVEVTYVPTGKTEPVKVTATKDPQTGKWSVPAGSDVTVDPDTGVITVPADKVEDGKEVSAVAKDKSGNTSTPTETSKANAKTPGEADTTAPAAPKVEAKDDGSVTVTPPTDADTKEVEVTYVPTGKTEPVKVTATKDPQTGKWSVPAGSDVTVDPDTGVITVPADKVEDGKEVSAVAKDKSGNASTPTETSKVNAKTPGEADTTAPAAPKVEAKDDGSVTVTPPTDADTKEVEVTYVPTGKTEPVKVTATKDPQTGKWSVPAGSDVTVDPDTGVITVPADKVEDGKEVSAVAKDKSGNTSTPTETSKANAKTPGEADTTAPAAPKVEAKDDGSVTVTPPTDADTKEVEVTYVPTGKTEPVKVTATKDPQTGKWSVPAGSDVTVDPDTGVITVPADKVEDGKEVSAVAKDKSGNASTPTETSKVNAKTPGEADTTAPAAPKVEAKDDGSVTVTPPTDADTKEVEVTYVPTGKTEPVKVTATKDPQTGKWSVPAGSDVTVDPDTGVITVPADKVEDGKEVSAVAKDKSGNTSTPTETSKANAKTPGEADTTAPAAPKVEAKDDGSVTVTPPTDADTKEVEVTYVPTGKTEPVKVTATKDPQTGKWSVPAGSDVTVDPDTGVITVPADKVEDGKEVSAVAKDKSGNTSTPTETSKANAKTPGEADTTAPAAPKVEAKDDGSVTVTPPTDADTKEVEVTYVPTGKTEPVKVTATKDPQTGKWSVPAGSDVTVDPDTGVITVPADKVEDGKEVSAVAKDKSGNASTPTETSKVNAKTPGEADTTAPAAPKVEAKDDGSVTVTPPTDADTKEVEVTYVPTGKTEPVKVTATKDPQTGKWSVPAGSDVTVDPDTGVITVPADKVEDGKEVSAVAKDKSGNASTPTETSKANAKTPGTTKPGDNTPDNGNKKALLPTDDYQDTGIKAGDGVDSNDISAIDEDGSYVPVYVDNNGNIIVKPGKDVDGPIKVTINKDGKERVIFIDILGHSMGHDDNGYRPGYFDGSYNIPGIRYRDHKTPTHPVTVTVPEKTETGVKVHDTLWYVFHINEFQYEVVRNGVVTKRLMDVTPVLQNGRTMLPLRYVAEALQADVKWDAKTRTATFTKDGLTASIQIDSDEIVLSNGKTVKMDSKPLNINNRILVSVTNVANVFGLTNGNTKDKADQDIEWEQQDKSATIYIRR